jgi:hypothetical protein
MFNERAALRQRLMELAAIEERVYRQCREERERIYERLRKLDEQERLLNSESTSATNSPSDLAGEIPSTVSDSDSVEFIKQVVKDTLLEQQEAQIREQQLLLEQVANQLKQANEAIIREVKELLALKETDITTKIQDALTAISKTNEEASNTTNTTSKKQRQPKRNTTNHSNYEQAYELAISILKKHSAAVQSAELKRQIEKELNIKIPNMTTFMESLMRREPNIEKPFRGQYIYRQQQDNEDISFPNVEKEIAVSIEESPVTEENIASENEEQLTIEKE